MNRRSISFVLAAVAAGAIAATGSLVAQAPLTDVIPGVKTGGSRNVHVLATLTVAAGLESLLPS